jgi:hypothetical protein
VWPGLSARLNSEKNIQLTGILVWTVGPWNALQDPGACAFHSAYAVSLEMTRIESVMPKKSTDLKQEQALKTFLKPGLPNGEGRASGVRKRRADARRARRRSESRRRRAEFFVSATPSCRLV